MARLTCKWGLVLILTISAKLTWAQSAQDTVGFTAVPPTKVEPKTPLSIISNIVEDPAFREMVFSEENRFKLLNQNTPHYSWLDQYRQKQILDEYSERVSKMFINSVKENFKETVKDALEDSSFSQIIDLAKSAKNITDKIKNNNGRQIAMNISPNPQEPSVSISNLGLDQIRMTYNVLNQSPALSLEQKIRPDLTSQLYYNVIFQTLDSALRHNITDTVHVHVINRNQLSSRGEKSLIFGVSLDIK